MTLFYVFFVLYIEHFIPMMMGTSWEYHGIMGKEKADKLNEADGMIFQTEKQLKEFGDKLSDDKKKPIEEALEELRTAHASQDVATIQPALDKINEAWKVASEEMYKAQADQQPGADAGASAGAR